MIIIQRKCTYTTTNKPKVTWHVQDLDKTIQVFKTKKAAFDYANMVNAWDSTLNNMFIPTN